MDHRSKPGASVFILLVLVLEPKNENTSMNKSVKIINLENPLNRRTKSVFFENGGNDFRL
jgi:hypothetical protein